TDVSMKQLMSRAPRISRAAGKGWRGLKRLVEGRERSEAELLIHDLLGSATPAEKRLLTQLYDDGAPLPSAAQDYLAEHSPRLQQLREAYADSRLPVTVPSLWNQEHLRRADLRYFRGESPYLWNYREWPRAMVLKYFIWTEYVARLDSRGLLQQLGEDGAFGCWTFDYPGYPP